MNLCEKILRRMSRKGGGAVFTRADFLDLGSTDAIGMGMMRLMRSGKIRRLGRGLYDKPRTHPTLGVLSPDAEAVARAVARRHGLRLQPSTAEAANRLHLSDQVPARMIYETDGSSKIVKIGKRTIEFQRRLPRRMATAGRMSGLVFGALQSLGKANVTPKRIAHLRELLKPADKRRLLKDLPLAPAGMHPHVRFIADGKADQ